MSVFSADKIYLFPFSKDIGPNIDADLVFLPFTGGHALVRQDTPPMSSNLVLEYGKNNPKQLILENSGAKARN